VRAVSGPWGLCDNPVAAECESAKWAEPVGVRLDGSMLEVEMLPNAARRHSTRSAAFFSAIPLALFAYSAAGQRAGSPSQTPPPNARWAVPVQRPGLPNLHRVSATLYRGAQPTAEGFRELRQLGVKTVVNLRAFHSDRHRLRGLDLGYEHIDFKSWHAEKEDLVRFLKITTDPERQPVFVHCQHGADRTGTAVAVYRLCVEGWSKDETIEEMTRGGFGFHPLWVNLIHFVRGLDVEGLRAAAGLATSGP
jgi:protein tyrosine phosphatase (PTP) superfamily phosphohydrolase (DUF442 family)